MALLFIDIKPKQSRAVMTLMFIPVPDNIILDMSKLKAFADNGFNVAMMVQFLAPLAKDQRAIVMALCPLVVRPWSVRNRFLQKRSPQKLLTGFLPNFTEMFLRWSSFK